MLFLTLGYVLKLQAKAHLREKLQDAVGAGAVHAAAHQRGPPLVHLGVAQVAHLERSIATEGPAHSKQQRLVGVGLAQAHAHLQVVKVLRRGVHIVAESLEPVRWRLNNILNWFKWVKSKVESPVHQVLHGGVQDGALQQVLQVGKEAVVHRVGEGLAR